jgi:hypothetical protein
VVVVVVGVISICTLEGDGGDKRVEVVATATATATTAEGV